MLCANPCDRVMLETTFASTLRVISFAVGLLALTPMPLHAQDQGTPAEVQALTQAISILMQLHQDPNAPESVRDAAEEVIEEWENGGSGRDIFFENDTGQNYTAHVDPTGLGFGGDITIVRTSGYLDPCYLVLALIHEGAHINQWHVLPFTPVGHEKDAIDVEIMLWTYLQTVTTTPPCNNVNVWGRSLPFLQAFQAGGQQALLNLLTVDFDVDDVPNLADSDVEGDLIANTNDNCPETVNPSQIDLNANGIGDRCDPAILDTPSLTDARPVASLRGGGKFLINGAVSIVRVNLVRNSSGGIDGSLRAYNYLTRTQVESVSISAKMRGMLFEGGDWLLVGQGLANVNGVSTNVDFLASSTGGVVTFEVRHGDTPAPGLLLAGGMGDLGRAVLNVTIGP
jgi:hypothetical protein